MSKNSNEVLIFLKTKIDLWINGNDGRNLSVLARRTGQSYSYLYRIYKQDAEINLQKITPILDEICTNEEIIDFCNTHFKNVANIASRYNQSALKMNSKNPGKVKKAGELKEYLKDSNYFHIIALCTNDKGVTKEFLIEQLGLGASSLLHELIDKKLLSIDSNGRIFLDGDIFFDDQAVRFSMMKSSIDIFAKRKTGVISSFDNDNFTIEAIRSIEAKIKELDEHLDNLRNDPKSKGDIPYCYLSALGRIDFPSNPDEQR